MNSNVSLRAFLLLTVLASAGTAAATSVLVRDPDPIVPAEGTLSGSNDLTVDQQSLTYQGTAVDGMSVTVNNTAASTSHKFVVHAALEDSSGTVLTTKTTTTKSISGGATKQVSLTFTNTYDVANVSQVEVTVEQTG